MARHNRVKGPKGNPHPPGYDSPRDIARRYFKQDVDRLVQQFLKDNENLDWEGMYYTVEGKAALLERLAALVASQTRPHHMKELV